MSPRLTTEWFFADLDPGPVIVDEASQGIADADAEEARIYDEAMDQAMRDYPEGC